MNVSSSAQKVGRKSEEVIARTGKELTGEAHFPSRHPPERINLDRLADLPVIKGRGCKFGGGGGGATNQINSQTLGIIASLLEENT